MNEKPIGVAVLGLGNVGSQVVRIIEDSADDLTARIGAPLVLRGVGVRRVAGDRGVPIELRVEVDYERLRLAYRMNGSVWQWLPQQFDASILSDEASAPGLPNFTGAFVGMACQDLAGTAMPADFDWFEYREREYVSDVRRLDIS